MLCADNPVEWRQHSGDQKKRTEQLTLDTSAREAELLLRNRELSQQVSLMLRNICGAIIIIESYWGKSISCTWLLTACHCWSIALTSPLHGIFQFIGRLQRAQLNLVHQNAANSMFSVPLIWGEGLCITTSSTDESSGACSLKPRRQKPVT